MSAAQKIPLATAPVTMPKPETYAEYLWRERTDIHASSDSDILPTNKCKHGWLDRQGNWHNFKSYGFLGMTVEDSGMCAYCPKCGEKL